MKLLRFLKNLKNRHYASSYKKATKLKHSDSLSFNTTTNSYQVEKMNIVAKDSYVNDELFYIKQNIRQSRRNNKVTQKDLSESLGFKSTSFISKLENGELSKIDHRQVEIIAQCIGVTVESLLVGYRKT